MKIWEWLRFVAELSGPFKKEAKSHVLQWWDPSQQQGLMIFPFLFVVVSMLRLLQFGFGPAYDEF